MDVSVSGNGSRTVETPVQLHALDLSRPAIDGNYDAAELAVHSDVESPDPETGMVRDEDVQDEAAESADSLNSSRFVEVHEPDVRECASVDDRPAVSAQCQSRFVDARQLQAHAASAHSADRRPHACDVCRKSFPTPSNLAKHRRLHTGQRRFRCSECGERFAELGTLTRHMRRHSGERPYACRVCGKDYAQVGHLTRHTMSHTGLRPVSCVECGKGFVSTTHLTLHMRTHSGAKPHACDRCGRTFNQLGNMRTHVRRMHPDTPSPTSPGQAEQTSC